jgi:hypothetical protein
MGPVGGRSEEVVDFFVEVGLGRGFLVAGGVLVGKHLGPPAAL